jgi:NAD(P)H dehydrogenase (quinone)
MKILTILAHPNTQSFNASLQKAYIEEAQKKHEIRSIKLSELNFDPILHKGYNQVQELEPDLKKVQEDINWADHVVFFYPYWWGMMPALLKGLFDRIMLPGFAFRFDKKFKDLWHKLLKGKTARIIVTTDAPPLYVRFVLPYGLKAVKHNILQFCGLKTKVTLVGPVKKFKPNDFDKALNKVRKLARAQ